MADLVDLRGLQSGLGTLEPLTPAFITGAPYTGIHHWSPLHRHSLLEPLTPAFITGTPYTGIHHWNPLHRHSLGFQDWMKMVVVIFSRRQNIFKDISMFTVVWNYKM